jgi:HK97 family phage major capsid protein
MFTTITIIAIIALAFIAWAGVTETPELDRQREQLRGFMTPEQREEFDRDMDRIKAGYRRFSLTDDERAKYVFELTHFIQTGDRGTGDVQRFSTLTTQTANGAMLPKDVVEFQTQGPGSGNVFRDAFEMLGLETLKTSVAELALPTLDTLDELSPIEEDANSDDERSPNLSESIDLKPDVYQSGWVYLSDLIWNANPQLGSTLLKVLGYVKEMSLGFAIGNAIVADSGIVQSVTTATTAGFTYDNLVDLKLSLPKRYRGAQAIFLGDEAYTAAEKMVGSGGQPILRFDDQGRARFNGCPVFMCDSFEDFGASKNVGATVSLLGMTIQDAGPNFMARREAMPARPVQTGVNVIGYHDFGWSVSAIAKLKTPAS